MKVSKCVREVYNFEYSDNFLWLPSGSGEVEAIRYLISHADVDALADLPEKSADSDSDSDLFIGFA